MDTTSQSIFEICKNINSYPHCFYGSFSRLSLEITMEHTLRVSIAPIFEEMKGKTGGKIAPGTKLYNEDIKAVFTLNHDDVAKIVRFWKEIRTNKYVNPDSRCKPEFKNRFTLAHFGNNNSFSTFSLTAKDNETNKLTISIKAQDGNSASFQLTNDDSRGIYSLNHFDNLIQNMNKNSIYDKLNFQATIKKLNSALYKIVNGDGNNNNNRSNNYNNNNNRNNNNNYNNNRNNTNSQPRQQAAQQQPDAHEDFDISTSDDFDNMMSNSLDDLEL